MHTPYPAPSWVRDLVIYEVNPRGFTSPAGSGDGSGSGTFRTLAERLPYLARLGITGLWLAGYCQATDHFYGVWSVYATVRPDRIDPALGTPDDLRSLVEAAHAHGIRVFLDVISHGVLRDSPLVAEHRDWFSGESWGMADYDYTNAEFRRWWADLWVSYVTDVGVDGYRVDISLQDPVLWDEVCERSAAAGREIVVFPEGLPRYHFCQGDSAAFSPDLGRDWEVDCTRIATVQVSCHDGGWQSGPGNHYSVRGSRARFGGAALLSHRIPLFFGGEEFDADQVSLPSLSRGLYGSGGPGGWLYGSQLRWEQLDDPSKAAMLADVTALIRVRRDNSDLLNGDRLAGPVLAVPVSSTGLVPFLRYRPGDRAILVAANETDEAMTMTIPVPVETIRLGAARYQVTDLVTGRTQSLSRAEIDQVSVTIGPDRQAGGGIRVLEIRPS